MKIGWIQIVSRKYGGVVYEEMVKKILSDNFDLEIIEVKSEKFKKGYLRAPEILLGLLKLKGEKDLWIRDNKTVALLIFGRTKGKNLAIIHHIDFSQTKGVFYFFDFILEKLIYLSLKKADIIVTVSEYWKNYFLGKGYKNVHKIYNCFDISQYEKITDENLVSFKKKYNLEGKPIIYLGNCQKAKGAVESYAVLKDLDVNLVTSGEPMVEIPIKNLNLEKKEYLYLLKAASLSVLMSKIKEGWNRTCHESMLLKTPVIGSGLGGMKELLEGGRQIVCQDFNLLRERVEYLLDHHEVRQEMGQDGYDFAKNFTQEKFKEDWLKLIKEII